VDLPVIEIDGVAHRRVLRCEAEYTTAAGPARVLRTLYSRCQEGERAVAALDLRAGVIGGFWTPWAAKQATWVVAHLTPQEGEDLFARLGGMQPSKSSLDRLPKDESSRWERNRVKFAAALRDGEHMPRETVTVAVSLDGVLVPMKDDQRAAKRTRAEAEGKSRAVRRVSRRSAAPRCRCTTLRESGSRRSGSAGCPNATRPRSRPASARS